MITCHVCGTDFDPAATKRWKAITCSDECSRKNTQMKQKARRARYQGTCSDCGAKTDGSNGRDKAPKRCNSCSVAHQIAYKTVWTRERIIASVRQWADEHGEPPGAFDWLSCPGYPAFSLVMKRFGSWNAAIEAAGYTPRKPGQRKSVRSG